jgi:signal transduction histidine kinase
VALAIPVCLFMAAAVIHLVYREYHRERQAKDAVLAMVTAEKERVERAMREKQRLLTVVSHDIANALTVLQNELSLTRFAGHPKQPTHVLDLDRMAYACANIDQIISSVRMLEALEQGRTSFSTKRVDLASVFEYAEVIFGKRLERRRMRFAFPTLTAETRFVMAEPRILANQVFGNLLSNAIKFSYPDSTITLSVTRQGDETVVGVIDRGIGIPTDWLGDLFTLEAKTTRTGTDGEPGTGFGLRTVKHFVELFGGRLVIASRAEDESPDDHGTTVEVRLKSGLPTA